MGRKVKNINPSVPLPVHVLKQASYAVAPIPRSFVRYLGLIEGQSILEVHIEDGKLVYTVKPTAGLLEAGETR